MATDLFDPKRCQATEKDGQCRNQAVEGVIYCPRHAGQHMLKSQMQVQYKLDNVKFSERFSEMLQSPRLRSLEDEIAQVKVLIEETLNQRDSDPRAMMQVERLYPILERLTKTSHVIAKDTEDLMPKQSVLELCGKMMDLMVAELEGLPDFHERVDRLCGEVGELFLAEKAK